MKKDLKEFFREIQDQGWSVIKSKTHTKLKHEIYGMVVCSSTPSCSFVIFKIKRDIKRQIRRFESEQEY